MAAAARRRVEAAGVKDWASRFVAITDDQNLISQIPADINAGQAWIVVPSAARAVGPIGIADYVAHITGAVPHADLSALEAHRIDPSSLPIC